MGSSSYSRPCGRIYGKGARARRAGANRDRAGPPPAEPTASRPIHSHGTDAQGQGRQAARCRTRTRCPSDPHEGMEAAAMQHRGDTGAVRLVAQSRGAEERWG